MSSRMDPVPPRLALWLLGNLFDYRLNYGIEEDMHEAFLALHQSQGAHPARRWYWSQTLKSLIRYSQFQMRGSLMMIKSAVMTALRSMRRQRIYAAINIVGFATGLASCLLIGLFVANELSYDRHHVNAGRIYRMVLEANVSGEEIHDTRTPAPMAFTLVNECPEVEQATRIANPGSVTLQMGDSKTKEEHFLFADSTVFSVFTIPLALGDPRTALSQPSGLVITPETARRCFGEDDPMGKRIQLEGGSEYFVTGVTEPMIHNSHFPFDFLAAFSSHPASRSPIWLGSIAHTYVLLRPGAAIQSLEQRFPEIERKYVGALIEQAMGVTYDQFVASGSRFGFSTQRLLDIHLHSDLSNEITHNGNAGSVMTLSAIALVILLIACINFVNLSTARSIQRANEVGVRKALGSHRGQLVRQFLAESVVQCALAFVVALGLVSIARPYFQSMMQNPMSMSMLPLWVVIPALFLAVLIVGMAAGIYPALVMASYRPMAVLRGKIHSGIKGRRFRAALVIFQLTASVSLLIAAMVIQDQMQYMRSKPLGFNQDQVVVLQDLGALGARRSAFKQALLQHTDIESATYSLGLPFLSLTATIFQKGDQGEDHNYTLITLGMDSDFLETYQIGLAQGRVLDGSRIADSTALLINETGARLLGLDDPVGHHLTRAGNLDASLEIVGVVKDFHLDSFREEMYPMVAMITPLGNAQYLSVRIRPERVDETLQYITQVWDEYASGHAIDYLFLDDRFENNYQAELQMQKLIGAFTGLALLVACLGLFGLASLTTKMRTKEIGIRKTLGASIPRIMIILSLEIVSWVGIANLLAWPLAWWGMGRWLQGFIYRTTLSPLTFLLAGIMALAVALVTVGQLTFKAATRRPVETLRYE